MDDKYIVYQSLMAARESANWAFGSMLGTWISSIFSIATLIFAKMALNTWKQQEALKAKKEFKMATLEMRYVVMWLPDVIDLDHLMVGRRLLYDEWEPARESMVLEHIQRFQCYAREYEKLEDAMQNCWKYWAATEMLFKGKKIEKIWKSVFESYNEYSQGKKSKYYFLERLDELIKVELYFTDKNH